MKAPFFLLLFLAVFAGCRPQIAEREALERGLPLMRQAIEAESQGNFDKAVEFYNESLLANPRAASAHLGLALLLQEHKQDFTAAVYHYQRYLDLQPGSQKEEMVRHRKKTTELFLTQQMVRKHGDAAGVIQQQLVQNIETFKSKIASLEAERTRLENENASHQTTIKTQAAEIERQKRLLDRVVAPAPAPQQAQQTQQRRLEVPDISTVKTAPRPTAIPSLEGTKGVEGTRSANPAPSRDTPPAAPPPVSPPPVAPPVPPPASPPSIASPSPAAQPRIHTVQAGETLYRISERYYNDPLKWTHIRDANAQTLGLDGRLRVGQVLTIPPLNRP